MMRILFHIVAVEAIKSTEFTPELGRRSSVSGVDVQRLGNSKDDDDHATSTSYSANSPPLNSSGSRVTSATA